MNFGQQESWFDKKRHFNLALLVFLSFLEDVFLCLVSFIFLVINLNSLLMIFKTTYSEVKLVKQNDNKQEHMEYDSIENRSCSWFSEIQFETCFLYVNLTVSNLKNILSFEIPKSCCSYLPISCTFGFNHFAFIKDNLFWQGHKIGHTTGRFHQILCPS